MGTAWSTLYGAALEGIAELADSVIVSHEELATGGVPAARRLFARCSLEWDAAAAGLFADRSAGATESSALHNLDRSPAAVARAWRDKVGADEIARLEAGTTEVLHALETRRTHLV